MEQHIEIVLNQYSATVMQLEDENYNILIDRPKNKGSSGQGLMGGQHLLVGIGGCFCSTLFASAQSRGVRIYGLRTEVIATVGNAPKKIKNISLNISYSYCSQPEEFTKLIKIAENGCISINTLKSKVSFDFNLI